jgi:hypothetical protein
MSTKTSESSEAKSMQVEARAPMLPTGDSWESSMDNLHTVKKYEVEYACDVLLNDHDVAIIRFESTGHEKVSVRMGRRLLEHLLLDIKDVLGRKLPIRRRG